MPVEPARPTLDSIGNYDLIEKVAEGGMGTVYRGRNRTTGDIVAVKVVAPHMISNDTLLKRFQKEFLAAKKFDHPNIVKAIEYGQDGATPYLVMEFVDGESLGQKIQREGPVGEKDAIRIVAQVAQGLFKAHKERLIHRDVKPDNIMIARDGSAKLTDLGLVKLDDGDLNLTRTGRGLGTPHFMAPEQFKNAKNADERCDIYSLGATLYMMVTGEMPFKSAGPLDAYMKKIDNKLTPARELCPSLTERTDWAIRRSMSADPTMRPASCREFVEDLTGRSTRKPTPGEAAVGPTQEIWYLSYSDENGQQHTVKGTVAAIRRSLKEKLLGDASNVRASRSKEQDSFAPLHQFPEFRDLVIEPAPMALHGQANRPARPPADPQARPIAKTRTPSTGTPPAPTTQTHPALTGTGIPDSRKPAAIPLTSRSRSTPSGGVPMWLLVVGVGIVLALCGVLIKLAANR